MNSNIHHLSSSSAKHANPQCYGNGISLRIHSLAPLVIIKCRTNEFQAITSRTIHGNSESQTISLHKARDMRIPNIAVRHKNIFLQSAKLGVISRPSSCTWLPTNGIFKITGR